MKSDNAARPSGTFAGEINRTLSEALEEHPNLVFGGQLIKYGYAGLTTGLYEKYPERFITYSVSEELMNSSAMGLALAGKRVVMFHVRLDFLLSGMNALFNHLNVWWKKGHKLPVTIIAQEGRVSVQVKEPSTARTLRSGFSVRKAGTPVSLRLL